MSDIGNLGLIIIIANLIASYKGFKDYTFYQSWLFRVDPILIGKDYKRLVTSGFIHAGWTHLLFNMFSLYAFSGALENIVGQMNFLLIYFGSLITGNLFSLYIHRHHGNYSAIGASGAVCGVIFASIALVPDLSLGLLFVPIPIPSWVFAILFVAISIRGIKTQSDNIGHDAHLGGGLAGMIIAIALFPAALEHNTLVIALVVIPSVVFIYLIITRPHILIISASPGKPKFVSKDDDYNNRKHDEQVSIDQILDKIADKGLDSLTQKEKDVLDRQSKKDH